MTVCPRCHSGDRLFRFEAPADLPARPTDLPVVCRECGCITVAGKEVALPTELEQQAVSMANRVSESGHEAADALKEDFTWEKVADYFKSVWRHGYLEGFWRAYVYFRHHSKEGRLVRLRKIWSDVCGAMTVEPTGVNSRDGISVTLMMSRAEYNEFVYLLFLGARESPHAADPSNQHAPV
jgi:hypothetical protein